MLPSTFDSQGDKFDMFLYPSPPGKRYPLVVLAHGNAGLTAPFGDQIRSFAEDLSKLGYFTAVPKYYTDNEPHLFDQTPHTQTLTDAIDENFKRPEVDSSRVGLIGFSLGATTSMTYLVDYPAGTVKVFADFFGFLTGYIRNEVSHFPPTILLHNKNDEIVPVQNSIDLASLLAGKGIEHLLVPPYNAVWPQGFNHSFKPGGPEDVHSRAQATAWFVKHLPPVGV